MAGVCLNMIVKNEAAILERCLASVAPFVDHYVIADTGSKDGTPDLIRDYFKARGVPGEVVHVPFKDFEQARNAALDAARASSGRFDYLLLTDADMELVVQDERFREQLKQPAHLVRQVSGIAYDNVRFVRRDLPARYIGVTHEYLDTCGAPGGRLDGVWFDDHEEGSNREVKASRDMKLLRGGLKKEPKNARYMFYLAQTLKDVGRFAQAIRWYERRIEAGGYPEEVWYAAYMIAWCARELGQHDRFVAAALRAHQMRPTRAEVLHLLARHHRERGENELAALFAETGARIPMPEGDRLFLEPYAYDFGLRHELAIAGYYNPRQDVREEAYEHCMDLATDPDAPAAVRNAAVANSAHFAVSGTSAFGSNFSTRKISVPPLHKGFRGMNPSVATTPAGELVANLRWVNYRIGYHAPGGVVRTRNELVRIELSDDAALVTSRSPVTEASGMGPLPKAWIVGYEDCRIFRWNRRWFATATVRDRRPDGLAQIALLELDVPDSLDGESRVVRVDVQTSINNDQHQKNWVPLVRRPSAPELASAPSASPGGEELLLIYEADPTLVLRVDPETRQAARFAEDTPQPVLKTLRGSSQAIAFELEGAPGWLYVAHEAFGDGKARRYTHRLVWLDAMLEIKHASDPFYFHHRGVEFCAGMTLHADRLVLSYGVEDAEAWIAIVEPDEARAWLLEPHARRERRSR